MTVAPPQRDAVEHRRPPPGPAPPRPGLRARPAAALRPPRTRAPVGPRARSLAPRAGLRTRSRAQAPRREPRPPSATAASDAPPTRAPPTAGPASDTPPPRHCACAPAWGARAGLLGSGGSLLSGLSRWPGTRGSAPRQPDAGGARSGWAPGRVRGAPLRGCSGEGARRAAGQLLK